MMTDVHIKQTNCITSCDMSKTTKYENFSGFISLFDIIPEVENATFSFVPALSKKSVLFTWHNGIWLNGVWKFGHWYDGVGYVS